MQGFDPDQDAESAAPAEKVIKVHEAAFQACGLHVISGGALFRQTRTYLEKFMDTAIATEGLTADAVAKEGGRVRNIWHRQLRTPLADGVEAMAAYREWESALPEPLRESVTPKLEKVRMLTAESPAVQIQH